MSILVTGASGFVGSYLREQEDIVDLCVGNVQVDLTSAADVHAVVDQLRPEGVIHLAAQSSVALSFQDPPGTFRTNFDGTYHLLSALKAVNFRGRMLYVGSAEVYGSVPVELLPVTENMVLKPRNPYAVSKAAAEALCYQWSQTGSFEIVMARPFNHIGPRQATTFAVADFASQIVACQRSGAARPLRVGDIDATRDFTDVRDVVRAYGLLLSCGRNGETYNVCSGIECSLRELIEGLFSVAGVRMDVEVAAERLRRTEQRRMVGSYEKLREHTGWEPRIALRQTLADIVGYWQSREGQP